jgi:putative tricarboxylic transport membrane protein
MKKPFWLAGLSYVILLIGMSIGPANAQFVPDRQIEIVVHNGPGSGPDLLARQLVMLIDQMGLSPAHFTVLNKTGGGSTSASSYLLGKKGNPYTIAVFTSVWVIEPLLQKEATTRMTDVTAIACLVQEPALVVTRTGSPLNSLSDFINAALANPGLMKQSGGSISSRENILRQQIMKKTGAEWTYISFPSGGERLSALLGGHVDMMIVDPAEAIQLVRGGKVKVLAQVADTRLAGFENVPTLKEAGYDVATFAQVRGIVGPPDMPPGAVAFYQNILKKVTETPAWAKYVGENHLVSSYLAAAESKDFLVGYEAQIRGLLTEGGVKVVR